MNGLAGNRYFFSQVRCLNSNYNELRMSHFRAAPSKQYFLRLWSPCLGSNSCVFDACMFNGTVVRRGTILRPPQKINNYFFFSYNYWGFFLMHNLSLAGSSSRHPSHLRYVSLLHLNFFFYIYVWIYENRVKFTAKLFRLPAGDSWQGGPCGASKPSWGAIKEGGST